ncbi:MAG: ATP-binding protein [Methanophagales archaeon]|nr:ATP-binding protein [Methanophagales archaeon]
MGLKNWDPLKASLSSELVSATIKRQIRNILKSYTGYFDPFSELIQNALDAVDNRKQKDTKYTPAIWIKIDLKENTICVTDNGVGFSEDQFKSFLAPNVSFKRQDDRGNKGVGATYLGYGFNFLQIGTKTPDFSFVGAIRGGREWVEDDSGTKTRPKIQKSKVIHDVFDEIDHGSTFSLKLVGDFIHPKDLKWVGATTVDQWKIVLRVKTPLGGIYFNRDCLLSNCHLTVIDEDGRKTEKLIEECEYIYPHKVISTCIELDSIMKKQEELIKKRRDPSRLPDSYYKLNGLYNYWNYKDFVLEDGKKALNTEDKELAEKYKISVYGFFCYSTNIWNNYNDEVVKLRKGTRILSGGCQLATNCMPQGELLMIPLTKHIGYQNVTHVIVHFEEAEPDLGRKGFQPELKHLAQHVATNVARKFILWRKFLKEETGAPPDIIGERSIHDWIREQEDHEKENPLIITREDVFLPLKEASITSEPLNEQDVIALFNQLLAGGVIRGIKLMATNQHQQYDGIFRFCFKKPFENHIFDKDKNPLGIESSKATEEYDSAPDILEYKYSFDALIEEFEKGLKNERQIKLVIAWEMGDEWQKRYEITPLLHFDNLQHRYFHGGTHIIKDASMGDTVFPAIILSELIEYINDPDDVQDYQRKTYIDL